VPGGAVGAHPGEAVGERTSEELAVEELPRVLPQLLQGRILEAPVERTEEVAAVTPVEGEERGRLAEEVRHEARSPRRGEVTAGQPGVGVDDVGGHQRVLEVEHGEVPIRRQDGPALPVRPFVHHRLPGLGADPRVLEHRGQVDLVHVAVPVDGGGVELEPPVVIGVARVPQLHQVVHPVACVGLGTVWAGWLIVDYVRQELSWSDFWQSVLYTLFTMLRVVLLMALATLVWVPAGIWIGLRPALAEKVQPLAQFLAAFPANVIFPVAVVLILKFSLNPDIWLSFLIVFGTQWYILFNVIAGASAFPNDLKEAVANFRIRGWDWWKNVIIPAIFPYYVTGALTASGGSWNAAIVAEYVKWGNDTVSAHGIGAYIAKATADGDYPKIVLGVAVMSIFVIIFNRLLWRPLYGVAEKRLRLD